jgi:hypothetical protein
MRENPTTTGCETDVANANDISLPKPITLTAEQLQQVAAGTAASLPPSLKPPTIFGIKTF